MTPRATMRLQFHKGFTFADAEKLVSYFERLGISHVYASPITTARPGSLHGYDVIDPTRVNPELGGETALRSLVAALRNSGLGLIADIVPNHMAVGAGNEWWLDVLRNGTSSRYAPYFDIDWNAEDESLRGKLLLPVLGKPLSEVIAAEELTVEGGAIRYFENRFPLRPDLDASMPLEELLAQQHYRLAFWRVANDEINWRRFFDINELAGLRMEHDEAFDDVHALIFRLYAEGLIDGVRVDHIDGLSDPASYCRALRTGLEALAPQRPEPAPRERPYIVVEKILLRGETLPVEWSCDGTSGYDFMDDVSAVQHDASAGAPLGELWQRMSGRSADFDVEEKAARREILQRSFSAQLETCAGTFHRLASLERGDISRASLRRALTELLAHFPIYRSYATSSERTAHDALFLKAATEGAKTTCLPVDRAAIAKIAEWIGKRLDNKDTDAIWTRPTTQFQQLSAPVAAKAVEDTAFYRYGRLLSRNDVGFDAECLGVSAADFHKRVLRRQKDFPHAMLATATHDHKRGEDVRARLAVLSEKAEEWTDLLPRWIQRCAPSHRTAIGPLLPAAGDIAMLLQMIVGAWPLDLQIADASQRQAFAKRLARWQEKALREAKLATDWSIPNEQYESAAQSLLTRLVHDNAMPELLSDIAAFVARIRAAGAVNGLAQTLLKLTVPGVPDVYQGTEFWDLSLVDPDNRTPVDFAARAASLRDHESLDTLTENWCDGRVKQAVIARTLALRRTCPVLFSAGSYEPLRVSGACAEHVIAFARRHNENAMVVIVPRAASSLLHDKNKIAFEAEAWGDTRIEIAAQFTNLFASDAQCTANIALNDVLCAMPVALLVTPDVRKAMA